MAVEGIKTVLLTRSSKKRVLRDNTITPIASQARKIKRRIVFGPTSLSEDSWYYTRGAPPSVVKYGEGYMLSVGYYKNPTRKGSKSNPRLRAFSIDEKLNTNLRIAKSYPTTHVAYLEKNSLQTPCGKCD